MLQRHCELAMLQRYCTVHWRLIVQRIWKLNLVSNITKASRNEPARAKRVQLGNYGQIRFFAQTIFDYLMNSAKKIEKDLIKLELWWIEQSSVLQEKATKSKGKGKRQKVVLSEGKSDFQKLKTGWKVRMVAFDIRCHRGNVTRSCCEKQPRTQAGTEQLMNFMIKL